MSNSSTFELTKELVEQVQEAVTARQVDKVRAILDGLHSTDINQILYELNAEDSKYVIELLTVEIGAEIISYIDDDIRVKFLKIFTPEELARYIDHIDSDDAADILNEQPVRVREEVIGYMKNAVRSNHIIELLRYDEDCAGGLMAKELVKAFPDWTVQQCIQEVRRQAKNVSKIYSVYVVDNAGKLLGRVSTKKLLLTDDEVVVGDLYERDVVSVESFIDQEEVVNLMKKYDLDAIPVVNVQGKLLGRITIDDIVDIMSEKADIDMQIMSGISEDVEQTDSVWEISKARLPWLVIGMMGGLLGAKFIGVFEYELSKVTAMAFFIPLITATGGNVGIQSSTLVVQSIANDTFKGSLGQILSKSLVVAIVNGLVIAGLVYGFNMLFGNGSGLAMVVAIALFCVVLLSSLLGTITPVLLNKIKVNPALASGPFITTSNDLIGIGVYFMVARMLLEII